MPSAGARIEAATLGIWMHCGSPLDNAQVYGHLVEGLAAAKDEYRAARALHDHPRAGRALDEVVDLTWLCAAAAEGMGLQRARWIAAGLPWPLGRVHTDT